MIQEEAAAEAIAGLLGVRPGQKKKRGVPLDRPAVKKTIKKEAVEHREILILRMQGLKPKEIAERLGIGYTTVLTVLGQPRAASYIGDTIDTYGQAAVKAKLAAMTLKAAQVLEDVMDKSGARDSDKIHAAKVVMDRVYGAATQVIQHKTDLDKMTDEELIALAKGN